MSFPERLSSLSGGVKEEPVTPKREDSPDGSQLVQRCVIIQRDEKGYGLTVSGDNPVFVQSVKIDGAAARAGVQQHDRIIKVNGTLVTSRNHIDVVKLIKSGSYVALTLLGKPPPTAGSSTSKGHKSFRDSTGGRITDPQPVDPEKDRELWQQKVHTMQAMYEQAKEDFEKIQKAFLKNSTEKLHGQLIEKENTVRKLEAQLRTLTGGLIEPTTPSSLPSPGLPSVSDPDHMDTPQSWAASLPTSHSDGGSISDSPHTSPSISPTPTHPSNFHTDEGNMSGRVDSGIEDGGLIPASQQNIITIDDEDFNSEEEQLEGSKQWPARPVSPFLHRLQALEGSDPGPYANITTLEKKPAHLAIFLHYLISNSDPSSLFFYIVSDVYTHATGNAKELRKWAYEIHSTFLVENAPLKVEIDSSIVNTIDCVLNTSANENNLRPIFDQAKNAVKAEIAELLQDFCSKKDLGLGNIYGVHELEENMDKNKEQKLIDKYLSPHLERCIKDNVKQGRDQAIGWALATFFRHVGVTKVPVERTQSFVMKDKRMIKLPGKSKGKPVRGHMFTPTHYVTTTFCSKCQGLIWGVGYQGYQCQGCDTNVHKQCVDDIDVACAGKQTKKERDKDKKRASAVIPVMSSIRKQSNPNKDAGSASYTVQDALKSAQDNLGGDQLHIVTQPVKREDEADLSGLPVGHGVKSIIQRYEDGPRSPVDNADSSSLPQGKELGRSESMKDKGKTGVRHERRTKSDVDMDDNTIKALDQSGSSSTSSLSNRADSSEAVNVMIANDSDLDVEADLPSLKSILGDEVIKKLKPKEKKRQEVLNELFYTERAHVRQLKILDQLFHRPMLNTHMELARSLFPNLSQMIELHRSMNNEMKKRRQENTNVSMLQVADILLRRFDCTNGEIFQQACAEYCRNQPHALEALKKHQRKEQRLSMFLNEAESSPLCRRLQLKDLLPAQMQRLTKYPLLIDNLMKYTQANSEEHTLLDKAKLKSKNILAYVNQSVKDCENFYRLRNLQRRLDLRPVENLSSHPSYEEMKHLELTSHKLVYDGNLSMRQRAHRMMEVHVVLLEDIMVLLQKQDDKLLLCQSNVQSSRVDPDKYINTHSPLLKLQNLLARNVATDKKAFFVVNTENSGPQIYEFVAPTQDERKKWMKYINDSVEEVKKRDGNKMPSFVPPQVPPQVPNIPPPEEITLRRDQITRSPHEPRSTTPPHEASRQSSQVGSETADMSQTNESALIQPDEVQISGPVVGQAEQVLTPIEKLRRNDETLESALEEREKIMAEIIGMPPEESRVAPEVPEVPSDVPNSRLTLITAAQEINNQVVHLLVDASSHSAQMAFPSSSPQTSHSGAARADTPKVTIPIPMEQLRDMATRMNQILAKLLTAVNNQDEEKESLREELQQAQEKLNSLREIQRAVMGGTLPYSPQSRPSSIVSVGSSVTEEGGDTEGGASQTPSVDDVADSLRAQAQQMMVEVGLPVEASSVDAGGSPRQESISHENNSKPAAVTDTGDKVPDESADKLQTAVESDSDNEYQEIPEEITSDVSQDHHQQQQQQAPTNSNNNSNDAEVMKMLNMENAKNEIVSVTEQFADKAEIESVISQSAEDMMSSTLTTDLDEGANDSDPEVVVPPDLGDLGETDTDSVQKLEGVVLPGGTTSEELVADERTKTDCDVGEDGNMSSSDRAEPVEI